MTARVKVLKLHADARLPEQKTSGAACFDVYSVERVEFWPSDEVVAVRTGLAFEVPKGYMLEIRPRSGMAKSGVTIANAPGTLDSDYRGELLILLCLVPGKICYEVQAGERIAQVRLVKLEPVKFVEAQMIGNTVRGTRGFGSTGR